MRADALGLFWEDQAKIKKSQEPREKREPPEAVWLRPDYRHPDTDIALQMPVEVMTPHDIENALANKEHLLFDIEVYPNYFLASFRSFQTGKVLFFEATEGKELDAAGLEWVLSNFLTIGFNSYPFDLPITWLAIAGKSLITLKRATDFIIQQGFTARDLLKQYKVKPMKVDHIDLIEVAPLQGSLKIYGGRLHTPKMQDLPFDPETRLTHEQMAVVRWYNLNSDLSATAYLYSCLREQLELRAAMSRETGVDLRSKSDAQIAEAVIFDEYQRRVAARPRRPEIAVGTQYRYRVPHYLNFQTDLLKSVLDIIASTPFIVEESGSIGLPKEVKDLKLEIAGSVYRMGIGGLHSSEERTVHISDANFILVDKDVTSYYPYIILNQSLYPRHLGTAFLSIYREIVDKRVAAKQRKETVMADSLKIVVNGSFGKLGSKYSILYSPDLLIQVTLSGQLTLLLLIERLELAGIHVVSANTDGITIKCPRSHESVMNTIVAQWERDTGFQTEEQRYLALYSRDVNNYIAIKEKIVEGRPTPDGVKVKGAYSNPWSSNKNRAFQLHKNPTNQICVEAIELLLTQGVPVEHTIRNCKDIRKFVTVRAVKGGAVKINNGTPEYLGKSIRWYYAQGETGEIVYASNGNKVPRTDGAKPLMELPDSLPDDIDFIWYINECEKMLQELGAS